MLGHCYFVSDADSRPPVSVLMADGRPADALLARSLAAFALSLHRRGILHNDFNSGNVLFGRAADGSYRFSLIDINRADIYPDRVCPSATLRAEELTRLTPDLGSTPPWRATMPTWPGPIGRCRHARCWPSSGVTTPPDADARHSSPRSAAGRHASPRP